MKKAKSLIVEGSLQRISKTNGQNLLKILVQNTLAQLIGTDRHYFRLYLGGNKCYHPVKALGHHMVVRMCPYKVADHGLTWSVAFTNKHLLLVLLNLRCALATMKMNLTV